MSKHPKWLINESTKKSTRHFSGKQENDIAKKLNGKITVNSGAQFSQNDVINDYAEIECKTTSKDSVTFKYSDWVKLRKKCTAHKIPLMVFEMQNVKKNFALLSLEDLKFLIDNANEKNI